MKYSILFKSFLIVSIFFLASCGGKKEDENPGGAVPLGSGTTIPVLKTEKARKAKFNFDLTEVIRKDDKVDMVVMVTNRSKEAMMIFLKEEFALTDNNGYIYRVDDAKVDNVSQFSGGMKIAKIPEDGKVKSIISFKGVRDDATSGKLFFKGEVNRGKTTKFKAQFNKVKLKK